MSEVVVRPATSADLVAVAAIYAHSVLTSTATFDTEEPPMSAWQAKLDSTAVGDHFLVAYRMAEHSMAEHRVAKHRVAEDSQTGHGVDSHGVVAGGDNRLLGYAYSGAFRSRPAYRHTRETSVYLEPDAMGSGVGTRLYSALLDLLRNDGVHLVVAVVTQPNPASQALHHKLGFTEAGTLDEVGHKFGTYLSTTTYQLRLT
jgi:phosphinothricin acetyltransferase